MLTKRHEMLRMLDAKRLAEDSGDIDDTGNAGEVTPNPKLSLSPASPS